MTKKWLLAFAVMIIIASVAISQSHIYPALDTDNLFTGKNSFNSLSVAALNADQFANVLTPGTDCGAKINYSLSNIPNGGKVVADTSCLIGSGVITTSVVCAGNQVIEFRPGTYPYSARMTLGTACTVQGPPSSINEDILIPLANPAVVLQQVSGSNLAPSFLISGANVVLHDFAIDLNARGGNTSGTGIDFNTGACATGSCLGHFRMYHMTVENGPIDDVHITSSGTANQASAWIIESSAITRAGQAGLTVTNSTDGRLLYNNIEENFTYGIREIDSVINAIGNDISTGSACAYITGDGNGADVQLTGGGDLYAYNSCVPTENVPVSASLFGGFVVQGYNGTAAPAVQSERFIGNTIVAGQGFITNTLDAIHLEDAGGAEITDNYFLSFPGQAWRYNVYVAYNHSGGQRDTAVDNEFSGNIGTAFTTSNGLLYLQGNNEAGNQTSTLQNAAVPNFNGANAGGLFCKTASGTNVLCFLMDSLNILEIRGDPTVQKIILKPDGTTQSVIITPTSVQLGNGAGSGIGTGTINNTDLAGFFQCPTSGNCSGTGGTGTATTFTYTFAGQYSFHPRCSKPGPEQNMTGNEMWMTYNASFPWQVTFHMVSPASGSTYFFDYNCIYNL